MRLTVHRTVLGEEMAVSADDSDLWFEMETDGGLKISSHFLSHFFDGLDGAVIIYANGERHSLTRDTEGATLRITTALGVGRSELAAVQPISPPPDVVYRGPRHK